MHVAVDPLPLVSLEFEFDTAPSLVATTEVFLLVGSARPVRIASGSQTATSYPHLYGLYSAYGIATVAMFDIVSRAL